MTCLRTELPEIKAQLKEYTDILGSYDAAYYVLSENNGYGLEFDSEGKDSKLYQDLLSHFNNDSKMAIREKSKVFLIGFKNTYKDLTIEPTAQQVLEYQSQDSLSEEAKSFFDTDKDLRERVDQAYNDLKEKLEELKDKNRKKNKSDIKCCATCKYCLSIPRNNRYGDIDYLCYIDGYFILSIYKDITKIKHYSPGGKVLDCKYKKIK